MGALVFLAIDIVIILVFLAGIAQFLSPRRARSGNLTAAAALALAVGAVLLRNEIHWWSVVIPLFMVGAGAGWALAARVSMVQIPAMVAFQHGAGGVAAFLVSVVELMRAGGMGWSVGKASGLLGMVIGAATFSGSMVASGKLVGLLSQPPLILRGHRLMTATLAIAIAAIIGIVGSGGPEAVTWGALTLIILSVGLGCVAAVRVGGADMPVLISFLNATAGLAAAFCGVIIQHRLLVACGATVAASGSVLTHVMCRAMNRSLLSVFVGLHVPEEVEWIPAAGKARREGGQQDTGSTPVLPMAPVATDPLEEALLAMREAVRVVVVPGYGMAVAQAQFEVVELANLLEGRGATVKYAVHPVAGRMPGHMNVLLAEAEVSYESLVEMDEVNPEFGETDLAIVVGACDVVNPAALHQQGTAISGMPILHVHEARRAVICNLDGKPGYSGVDNPLYRQPGVVLLFGDAKETLARLIARYRADNGRSRTE